MAELEERLSKTNQSVEKAFSIIELLSKNKDPMRIQDISRELNINASTLVRFLTTLMKCGYVAQDQMTSRYFLTYKVCSIAYRVSSQPRLPETTHPFLKRLSESCNESVCLAVEQDMLAVYIDVVEGSDQMLRTTQRIGNVAPMHCTGVGKVLLMGYDEERLDRLIEERGLQHFTPNTLTSKESLMRELEEIRRRGYAYDNEECEIGSRCIAAPVRDYTGNIIAALSITGPIFRMGDEVLSQMLPVLLGMAKTLSEKFGYDG